MRAKKISKKEAIAIVHQMIARKNAIHEAIKKGESSESLKKKGIKLATPV